MRIVDLRDELPRAPEFDPWPTRFAKASSTVHWPDVSRDIGDDDDCTSLLFSFAAYHIDKDWSREIPGVQYGGGIMYTEAVAPSGTVFLLRDDDAVLWHSDDAAGNLTSRAILLLVGTAQKPTRAQLLALRARLAMRFPAYPHGPKWAATECPGPAARAFLAGGMQIDEETALTEAERRVLAAFAKRPDLAEKLVEHADTVLYMLEGTSGPEASGMGYQVGSYGHTVERVASLEERDALTVDDVARAIARRISIGGTA